MGDLADDFRFMKEQRAKERAIKEPRRLNYAVGELQKAGHIVQVIDHQTIRVDGDVTMWVFTGWFSGKGVGSGRGIHNLIKKLSTREIA